MNQKPLRLALALLAKALLCSFAHGQSPPASISAWDVHDPGAHEHALTVFYQGEDIRPGSFDDKDLRVEGAGFVSAVRFKESRPITYIETVLGHTAFYAIEPPPGGWSAAYFGPMKVILQPDQVATTTGFLASGQIGEISNLIGEKVAPPKSANFSGVFPNEGTIFCSPDQPPDACHQTLRVDVSVDVAEGTFIHNFDEAPRLEGGKWVVDLLPAKEGSYPMPWAPFDPTWHAVDWAGPLFPRWHQYVFQSPPGDYEFQMRAEGKVLVAKRFRVEKLGKIAGAEASPILWESTEAKVVTVRYWHPEGIDLASLGDDDLALENVYRPGRPLLAKPVEFVGGKLEASGWTAATYRIAPPSGGWTREDNWYFGLWVRGRAVRTVAGSFFDPPKYPLPGFDIRIPTGPWIAGNPIRTSFVAEAMTPGATRRSITVHYYSETPIDMASLDSRDLSADGQGVLLRSAKAYHEGREVEAVYDLPGLAEFTWQAPDKAVMPIQLKANQVKTIAGASNAKPVEVGRFTKHSLDPRRIVPILSSVISGSGQGPLRFSIRYASLNHIVTPPEQARVDVVAAWLPMADFEGAPPIPYRQTAKITGSHSLDGGKSLTVNYEVPAPPLGWTHLVNGPLEVEVLSSLRNEEGQNNRPGERIGALWINAMPPDVEVSLKITHEARRVVGRAKVKAWQRIAPQGIDEWRGPTVEGQRIYLDAVTSFFDCDCVDDPEFRESEREFTLYDLTPPLNDVSFGPYEVVVRVNGQAFARDTFTAKAPPTVAIAPDDVRFDMDHGFDPRGALRIRVNLAFKSASASSIVVVKWGRLVAQGENLIIEGAEFRALAGEIMPGETLLQREYRLENYEGGPRRVEFAANGRPLAETFWIFPRNPFEAWLRQAISDNNLGGMIGQQGRHPLGDLDGDGASDFAEYAFGTSPLDASSQPKFAFRRVGQVCYLSYRKAIRGELRLLAERSSDLKEWSLVRDAVFLQSTEPVDADGTVNELVQLPVKATGQEYFRLRAFRQ